jgi:hypothetical protein
MNENNQSEQAQSVLEEIRCLRPDKYEFLDSKPFDANKPYDNLPNETVSEYIADGALFVWETGFKERVEGIVEVPGVISNNVDEQATDDELLLRPVDDK